MKTITVVIADDELLAREGTRALLAAATDIKIIGEAENGDTAKELVEALLPNILLLDVRMPGPGAVAIEKWVRENYPQTIVLPLTAHHHSAHLSQLMEAGAAGYLKKNTTADELADSIRKAASGTIWFSNEQIAEAKRWKEEVGEKWDSLSAREREILNWVALGAGKRFLTKELSISPKTLENHITRLLKKLNVESCAQAASWYYRNIPEEMQVVNK